MESAEFSESQKKFLSALLKRHCDALCAELKGEVRALKDELYIQRNKIQSLEEENQLLRNQVNQLDRKSRQKNLIFYGLSCRVDEVEQRVKKTLEENLQVEVAQHAISDIHKLGKDQKSPILLELNSRIVRLNILHKASKLKGTGISISPDYTLEEREQRRILVRRMKESIEEGNNARIRGNKLVIDNKQLQQVVDENRAQTDLVRPEVQGVAHRPRGLRPRQPKASEQIQGP